MGPEASHVRATGVNKLCPCQLIGEEEDERATVKVVGLTRTCGQCGESPGAPVAVVLVEPTHGALGHAVRRWRWFVAAADAAVMKGIHVP
jgi:hypothetical protein